MCVTNIADPSKMPWRKAAAMVRESFYRAKWHLHHPAAFARFSEIMANLDKSSDQLAAEQILELSLAMRMQETPG